MSVTKDGDQWTVKNKVFSKGLANVRAQRTDPSFDPDNTMRRRRRWIKSQESRRMRCSSLPLDNSMSNRV